jgi:CRP-like cAMP-binding protein
MNLGLETGTAAPALIAALRPHLERARLWQPRRCPRGAVVFGPDADAGEVVLLLSGLVKLVYTTEDGADWIKSFVLDQGVFAPADGDGAPYGAVCLEGCALLRLPRAALDMAAATDAGVREAALAFSAWVLRRKQAREAALLSMTPEARYRALLAHAPQALARLPQGDIARFLGITPIAFSRIKRRMKDAP